MDPVIIIGAPRSGTNMLRDVLCRVPGFETWPCDEINLLWRHGNRTHPSDELPPELARPEVQQYVRGRFARLAERRNARVVVEKTCANSLRVAFVNRIVPNARYLFITRDGLDAAASAMQRWHAPLDLRYTLAKTRFVPPTDIPYYGSRFVRNRLRARTSKQNEDALVRAWWGPRLKGQDELQRNRPLEEICAVQWQRCVDNSERDFVRVPSERVHRLSYEGFVTTPERHLAEILEFLGEPVKPESSWVADVSGSSVGKGRASLGPESAERLTEMIRPSLERYGYV